MRLSTIDGAAEARELAGKRKADLSAINQGGAARSGKAVQKGSLPAAPTARVATARNQRWRMDSVSDRLVDGHRFRVLSKSLLLLPDSSLGGENPTAPLNLPFLSA